MRGFSELVGCNRPTRMQTILADPMEGRLVFFSPAALGSFRSSVAYAVREEGRTVVEVRDLADSTTEYPPCGDPCGKEAPVLRRLPAAYHPRRKVGVETLEIGRGQAVAWTTCRFERRTDYGYDECRRSYGALVRVWRAREGASKIDLLDQGRKMYPRSLRIDGDRIYWRSGDRMRSARL